MVMVMLLVMAMMMVMMAALALFGHSVLFMGKTRIIEASPLDSHGLAANAVLVDHEAAKVRAKNDDDAEDKCQHKVGGLSLWRKPPAHIEPPDGEYGGYYKDRYAKVLVVLHDGVNLFTVLNRGRGVVPRGHGEEGRDVSEIQGEGGGAPEVLLPEDHADELGEEKGRKEGYGVMDKEWMYIIHGPHARKKGE